MKPCPRPLLPSQERASMASLSGITGTDLQGATDPTRFGWLGFSRPRECGGPPLPYVPEEEARRPCRDLQADSASSRAAPDWYDQPVATSRLPAVRRQTTPPHGESSAPRP